MNPDIRSELGRAAYEALTPALDDSGLALQQKNWYEVDKRIQESFCIQAESVVKKLAEFCIIPVLNILLTENEIKSLLTSAETKGNHE